MGERERELYQRVVSTREIKRRWNLEHVCSGFAAAGSSRRLYGEFIRFALYFRSYETSRGCHCAITSVHDRNEEISDKMAPRASRVKSRISE